jgi:hypothetical protein
MICGSITEIGRGFPEVLLQIKMEIMVLKEFHHPPILLEQEAEQLVGLIMMATFGYLVEVTPVIHNANICE